MGLRIMVGPQREIKIPEEFKFSTRRLEPLPEPLKNFYEGFFEE
jgi:hypothetical protein